MSVSLLHTRTRTYRLTHTHRHIVALKYRCTKASNEIATNSIPPCRGIARKQCRGLDFWGLHIKFGLISLYSLSLFTVRIHLGLGFLRIHLGFKPVTPP